MYAMKQSIKVGGRGKEEKKKRKAQKSSGGNNGDRRRKMVVRVGNVGSRKREYPT
jgi:hypothetical protein